MSHFEFGTPVATWMAPAIRGKKGIRIDGEVLGGIMRQCEADIERQVHVISPTLLIVSGNDAATLALNEKAIEKLSSLKKLEVVGGATHLFEEPRALEQVGYLANAWFAKYR